MHKLATLLLALIAFAPAVARADKDLVDSATYDCGADPVVNIAHGGGTYTFTGACTQVNLNGDNVSVTIADAAELNINGAGNTIVVAEVGSINVNGTKNKVSWKKAKTGKKPEVAVNGKNNAIAHK